MPILGETSDSKVGSGLEGWPLAVLAVLLSLPTLIYPWSGDFALFDYVASTVWHGGIPYRDALDIKPVGMLPIIWLSQTLFGGQIWSIRLMEICGILLTGWSAAAAYRYFYRDPACNLWGAASLLAASYYYASFNFWNTSQLEIWIALALLASLCFLLKPGAGRGAWFFAGAFAGWAFLIKFPACLPAAGMLCVRLILSKTRNPVGWKKESLQIVLSYVLGLVSIILAMTIPLVIAIGSAYAYQINFVLLPFYARSPVFDFHYFDFPLQNWGPHLLLIILVTFGATKALLARRWRDLRILAALFFLAIRAFTQVMLQEKFFRYHFAVLLPFVVLLLLWSADQHKTIIPTWLTALGVTIGCFATGIAAHPYWLVVLGSSLASPANIDSVFQVRTFGQLALLKEFAEIVNAEKQPNDNLCVDPLEATYLYKLTGLRCSSRFFYVIPVDLADRYDSDQSQQAKLNWGALRRKELEAAPPKFFVIRKLGMFQNSLGAERLIHGLSYAILYSNQDYVLLRLVTANMGEIPQVQSP